jgi:hypothetical protein
VPRKSKKKNEAKTLLRAAVRVAKLEAVELQGRRNTERVLNATSNPGMNHQLIQGFNPTVQFNTRGQALLREGNNFLFV